jgi:hypothetical protein
MTDHEPYTPIQPPKPITTQVRKLQSFRPKDGGLAVDKSLRDEIAIAAMQPMISDPKWGQELDKNPTLALEEMSRGAYTIADYMLAAREESE